jgi:hypothetical protein
VDDKVGTHLTCTTELDGQTLAVTMTITGAHGQASLRPTSAVVTKGTAEAHLATSLAGKLKGVQVFCAGPALLVVPPGHSFNCQADAAGVQRQVVVTVANVSGRLHYRVLRYRG